jgi:uroporphyrin-III C-methyltransferase
MNHLNFFDYIDKDKVLKQEHERNLDDSLYVIKGSKEDALLRT